VRAQVLETEDIGQANLIPENSFVFASDGSLIAELTFEENRNPVTLDEVPQVIIDAVLATEDVNFYEHAGVNHLAIVRAFITNLVSGGIESGASTITQQYVKLAFLTPEQTYKRKIQEALYAVQIERQLTKDEILERYLNRANFGRGTYGVGTAATRFLSTELADVTVDQAAMLAGMLRAPEANNPINSPENARARRNVVLAQMASAGFITREEAEQAQALPLRFRISEPPAPEQPFWSDWVARLLINEELAEALGSQTDALRAMGSTSEERRRRVFQTGLRITTTLDPRLQALAEDALRVHLTAPDGTPADIARSPDGAIISVEPGTGAIRALAVGPREFGSCAEDDSWVEELEDGQLLCDKTKVNAAIPGAGGSGRQPGSAFKPFVRPRPSRPDSPPGYTLDARGPALSSRAASASTARSTSCATPVATTSSTCRARWHARATSTTRSSPRTSDRCGSLTPPAASACPSPTVTSHARSASVRPTSHRCRWPSATRRSRTVASGARRTRSSASRPLTVSCSGRTRRCAARCSTPRSLTRSWPCSPDRSTPAAPHRWRTSVRGRPAARPARPTTTSTHGSSAWCASWRPPPGSASRRAPASTSTKRPRRRRVATRRSSTSVPRSADADRRHDRRHPLRPRVRWHDPGTDVEDLHGGSRRTPRAAGLPGPPPRRAGTVPDLVGAFDAEDAKLRAELAGFTLQITETPAAAHPVRSCRSRPLRARATSSAA
jgi:hypothetical protein